MLLGDDDMPLAVVHDHTSFVVELDDEYSASVLGDTVQNSVVVAAVVVDDVEELVVMRTTIEQQPGQQLQLLLLFLPPFRLLSPFPSVSFETQVVR